MTGAGFSKLTLLAAWLLPGVALAQQAVPSERPPRLTLGLRATVQRYDIRLGGYPFGQRWAVLLPLQFVATYRLGKQLSLQTGLAWHTTRLDEAPRRYLNSRGQLVEAHQKGLLSVGVPLLLRYAYLPGSPERRWNGHVLAGFTALLTRTTLSERTVPTGQTTDWANGQLALMPTLGAGSSYRLSPRWQAEAEIWFSRSPATGFAPRNVGAALGMAYRL